MSYSSPENESLAVLIALERFPPKYFYQPKPLNSLLPLTPSLSLIPLPALPHPIRKLLPQPPNVQEPSSFPIFQHAVNRAFFPHASKPCSPYLLPSLILHIRGPFPPHHAL